MNQYFLSYHTFSQNLNIVEGITLVVRRNKLSRYTLDIRNRNTGQFTANDTIFKFGLSAVPRK